MDYVPPNSSPSHYRGNLPVRAIQAPIHLHHTVFVPLIWIGQVVSGGRVSMRRILLVSRGTYCLSTVRINIGVDIGFFDPDYLDLLSFSVQLESHWAMSSTAHASQPHSSETSMTRYAASLYPYMPQGRKKTYRPSQRNDTRRMPKNHHPLDPLHLLLQPSRPSLQKQIRPIMQLPDQFSTTGREQCGSIGFVDRCWGREEGG